MSGISIEGISVSVGDEARNISQPGLNIPSSGGGSDVDTLSALQFETSNTSSISLDMGMLSVNEFNNEFVSGDVGHDAVAGAESVASAVSAYAAMLNGGAEASVITANESIPDLLPGIGGPSVMASGMSDIDEDILNDILAIADPTKITSADVGEFSNAVDLIEEATRLMVA
jgi:hypothetical protein